MSNRLGPADVFVKTFSASSANPNLINRVKLATTTVFKKQMRGARVKAFTKR